MQTTGSNRNINRRSALKYFIILSAGAALLPTCKPDDKKYASPYVHLSVDEDDQAMLAKIAEVIIPDTNTPGSKAVSAHVFALQMMNDCYEQKDRDIFMKGMKQFESDIKKKYGKSFTDCSAQECEAIIGNFNQSKDDKDKSVLFYNTMKQLTIRAYTNSEYYLTNVRIYKHVPGKFKSSVPV